MLLEVFILYILSAVILICLMSISEMLKNRAEGSPLFNYLIVGNFFVQSLLIILSLIYGAKILQKHGLKIDNDWLELIVILAPLVWLSVVAGVYRSISKASKKNRET